MSHGVHVYVKVDSAAHGAGSMPLSRVFRPAIRVEGSTDRLALLILDEVYDPYPGGGFGGRWFASGSGHVHVKLGDGVHPINGFLPVLIDSYYRRNRYSGGTGLTHADVELTGHPIAGANGTYRLRGGYWFDPAPSASRMLTQWYFTRTLAPALTVALTWSHPISSPVGDLPGGDPPFLPEEGNWGLNIGVSGGAGVTGVLSGRTGADCEGAYVTSGPPTALLRARWGGANWP